MNKLTKDQAAHIIFLVTAKEIAYDKYLTDSTNDQRIMEMAEATVELYKYIMEVSDYA